MIRRILAIALAVTALVGFPQSAQAAEGDATLSCNTYNSTGWVPIERLGVIVGEGCMTLREHNGHEDVTYWVHDLRADGLDMDIYRNLSWVDDGWVRVASANGAGTYASSSKMYDITSSLRWAQGSIVAWNSSEENQHMMPKKYF